jgi:predicted transcriptional regulator
MKRERLEIIKDILEIVKDNISIKTTPLLRKSNLSSQRFTEYLTELLKKELLKESLDKKQKKIIKLTDKGFKYLEKYRTIKNFIDEFDL